MQEDNDPKHASLYCRDYLRKKEQAGVLTMMNWPSQSPDMNLIESLWAIVDSKIPKGRRTSKDEMWQLAKEAWRSVTQREIDSLFESMPRRMKAVIQAKGGHTKY